MMQLDSSRRNHYIRYGIAIAVPLAAAGVRTLLSPLLHDVAPLQLFTVGVVVSAWLGGFWPGILSTVLGFTISWWFFIPPDGLALPDEQNLTRMLIFLVDCLAISAIGESMQRTLTRERGHRQALYKLAAIVESSEDAIISKNLDGTITSWNQAAERIFGYSMGEAIGQHISLLIPKDRLAEETEIIQRVQQGLSINHFETVRRRKDGALIDVSLTISPVKDSSGKTIGASKIARDVTEKKKNEAALHERENQLQLITDHAPVYLAQLDRNHHYKFVNRPYASSYGRLPQEIIGLHIAEIIGAEAYQTIRGFLDEVSAGQQVESEMEVVFPTIGARWMVFIFVPEFDAGGVLDGFMVVITDITQRKRGEEELEKARDEALAASQAKDNFLSTLSHELRTPLNPVLLLASDAIRDRSLPPQVRADFELIYKNVSLEARLIDDMLDLTRITRGKVTLNPQLLDAHILLRECVEIVHSDIEDKMIHLELDLAATNSFITADPVRLQQIFWNLLKNALKFTPNDGRIAIRTTNSQDRDRIRVEISDTGIGLTPQEQKNAFQVFSQGEHAEKGGQHRYGGLGLGLAICRRLVEMHHGQIEAASAGRNLGASFFVTLPCSAPRVLPDDPQPLKSNHPAVPTSRNILLVEDHDMTRSVLSRLLTRHGHKVSVAACVEEALTAASEGSYDLVISDLGLPDGDGHTLMNKLRGTYGMTGIALSGYGMETDINRSLQAGFYAHLTKPVDMEALLKTLAEIPKPAS